MSNGQMPVAGQNRSRRFTGDVREPDFISPNSNYRTATVANNCASREAVAIKLQRLKPQLRMSALLLLGIASVTDAGLLLAPGPWVDRIPPVSILLFAIVLIRKQLLKERRIAVSYASTLGRIVRFERRRRGRTAIYEYESPAGIAMTGKAVR